MFDQRFNILRSHRCDYLHHCHEIAYDGGGFIYLSATSFDSVLRFNIETGRFDRGWWIRSVQRVVDGKTVHALDAVSYDPGAPGGAERNDTLHINNVCVLGKVPLFSGLSMNLLVAIQNDEARPYSLIPVSTHNAQPLGKGLVMNSTGQDAAIMTDRRARLVRQFPYPRYDEASLTHTDVPNDYARQAFGRGLCVDRAGRLIIAGSSPGTVSAFDVPGGRVVASVQVSADLRNAPHGLEIWPY